MILNFVVKRKKLGLVPPALQYCGHSAKKKSLQIYTLHTINNHLSAALLGEMG